MAWTYEDLAQLTELAMDMEFEPLVCESCKVVDIAHGEKYCQGCIEDITNWLFEQAVDEMAREIVEKLNVEKGWY